MISALIFAWFFLKPTWVAGQIVENADLETPMAASPGGGSVIGKSQD